MENQTYTLFWFLPLHSGYPGPIIARSSKFLMEMGKGFAFVERQKYIHTEKNDYYMDLVFYNYLLKCMVFALKSGK